MRAVVAMVGGLTCGIMLGCAGLMPQAVPAPDDARQAEALAWADALDDGSLPADLDCDRHAETLPWLSTVAEPDLARAALLAMGECAGAPEPRREAILLALVNPEPKIAGAALSLAAEQLADATPDDPLLAAVADALAHHPDKGVRYEAVEAFDRYLWAGDPVAAQGMLRGLTDEAPPVVSEVLERATFRAAGLSEPLPWVATARFGLRAHLDPAVRGRSALLLARLAPEDPLVRSEIRELLADKHPFARSAAATALGQAGDLASVRELFTLLDDAEPNGWTMLPWSGTNGQERRQVHVGSHFERVDDAMLRALEEVTASMGEDGFHYREVQLKYLDLDLISARRDAARWLEEHGDALPSPPAEPSKTD